MFQINKNYEGESKVKSYMEKFKTKDNLNITIGYREIKNLVENWNEYIKFPVSEIRISHAKSCICWRERYVFKSR